MSEGISQSKVLTPKKRNLAALWYNPRARGYILQALLALLLGFLAYSAVTRAIINMDLRNMSTDFSFWHRNAGFEINQTLISYSAVTSTYGEAFWVGLLNTALVSAIALVFATLFGFLIGIGRLSSNWIVARLATVYVELIRNIPLLLQLLFIYNVALRALPAPRDSVSFGGVIFMNKRGLFIPHLFFESQALWFFVACGFSLCLAFILAFISRRYKQQTGRSLPFLGSGWLALLLFPAVIFWALGFPVGWEIPQLKGFNFSGGWCLLPEFLALTVGLSLYTASFIAEVVRGGLLAVNKGQREAAFALGLSSFKTLRFIIIPQALKIIIPPLTNQYLNLIKNSSLAVFIGYPDLVQVFAGTVLNQSGASVQIIAMTMSIYLVISLCMALLMSLYNRTIMVGER